MKRGYWENLKIAVGFYTLVYIVGPISVATFVVSCTIFPLFIIGCIFGLCSAITMLKIILWAIGILSLFLFLVSSRIMYGIGSAKLNSIFD